MIGNQYVHAGVTGKTTRKLSSLSSTVRVRGGSPLDEYSRIRLGTISPVQLRIFRPILAHAARILLDLTIANETAATVPLHCQIIGETL
jgi:hypothetical protein